MFKKRIIAIAATFFIASVSIFSSEAAFSAYVEGCQFYADEDWTSAKIMLKKAVSYSENFNPDVYYMLITAEMYEGDEKTALDDCNVFLKSFPDSSFYSRVKYNKGRILYNLGEYEKAILELSDFCHQYVDHELYSYALFYVGESLFAGYKYDESQAIFERIVNEFPNSEKTPAAQYRIDTILQKNREEKLLYLLKQTGEEYLSAKEEYEKQMKMYNSDTILATRQKLEDSQAKNNALEKQIADLELQLEEMKAEAEKLAVEAQRLEAEKQAAEELAASMAVPAVREVEEEAVTVSEAEEESEAVAESKEEEAEKEEAEKEEAVPTVTVEKDNVVAPDKETEAEANTKTETEIVEKKSAEVKDTDKVEKNADADNADNNGEAASIDDDVPNMEPYDETREQIRILKEKANDIQKYVKKNQKK